jgi:hypothetical protein
LVILTFSPRQLNQINECALAKAKPVTNMTQHKQKKPYLLL